MLVQNVDEPGSSSLGGVLPPDDARVLADAAAIGEDDEDDDLPLARLAERVAAKRAASGSPSVSTRSTGGRGGKKTKK